MRRSLLVFLVGPVSLLTSIQLAFADTSVVTDPVGFTTTPLSGNSDTFVSVPFTRPPVFIGAISSAAGNTITAAGNPWMANQFVYGGTQHDRFYALIGSFTPTTSPHSYKRCFVFRIIPQRVSIFFTGPNTTFSIMRGDMLAMAPTVATPTYKGHACC
jgi:hypothetical protein